MWLLIPLTLLPQYLMGERGAAPVFGPDTSTGLVPLWHVLAYYALFFAFGALAYGRRNRAGTPVIEAAGRGSMFILPVTFLVVFPVALVLTFESHGWLTASVAQVIYTWAMIFGLLFACGGFVFLVVMGKMWFKEAKSRFQNPRTRIPSSWMSVIATTLMG